VTGLRIAAAWLAGITHMRWTTFFFWNMLGGIAWATTVGLAAYLLGDAVKKILEVGGLAAVAVVVLVLLVAGYIAWRRRRARVAAAAEAPPEPKGKDFG
jgi:membrane protein DedA with SNARE-associated domain